MSRRRATRSRPTGPGSSLEAMPDLAPLVARNAVLNLGGLAVPLVVALVAVPVVVNGLGTGGFGLLSLIWVMLGYMALLDLGLGRATTKFAAEALATGDLRTVAASARIAAALQLALGLAAAAALVAATPALVGRFLDIPAALAGEARRSFRFVAAVTPVIMVTNTFRGLLEAKQSFGVINAVKIPVGTANFLVPMVGVLAGWPLSTIVAVLLSVRAVALVVYAAAALRAFPSVLRGVEVRGADLRALLGFGGWVTVSGVVSPVLVYVDRFVVGALRSVEAVGYYAAPHELILRLAILPSSVASTLFPALSATAGAGREGETERLVAGVLKFLLMVAGPALVVLGFLAGDVLTLWLGEAFAARAAPALRLFTVGMAANVLAYVPAVLLPAAGRPDVPAKLHLAELPVYLPVLWLLAARWGVTGAAAAWALRMFVDAVLLFVAAVRVGLIRPSVIAPSLRPAAGWVGALALATAAVSAWPGAPLARLAAVAGMLLLMAVVAWRVLLSAAERSTLFLALRVSR